MLQEVSHLLMHKAFSYSWQAAMPSASPLLINLTLSFISYICYPLTKKSFARRGSFYCLRRNHKSQLSHLCFLFVASLIFLFCCQSAADMPLRFVDIQNFSGLLCQKRIDLRQTFCRVLMHRTLTDSKSFCCLAHRRMIVYNILSDFHSSFFDILFQ